MSNDQRRRRDGLRRSLLLVALTPVVVYGLVVLVGVPLFNHFLGQGVQDLSDTQVKSKPVTSDVAQTLALLIAGVATLGMAREAWGRRSTTEAWRKGAEGERMTGGALDGLEERGYLVLHDRRMPGSRANIDHVVIGPTGIYVVETKHYAGRVVISGEDARCNGRSIEKTVDQVWRQVAAVEFALGEMLATLGLRVRPVVCVQGATVTLAGWGTKPIVRGARFCSGGRLRAVITEGDRSLGDRDIATVTGRLQAALAPAA
ncbi:MAG: nuclease-related domain-containing protein [Acidimicrobiales bacterium]